MAVAQLAARRSHNPKVVSSFLTCRKASADICGRINDFSNAPCPVLRAARSLHHCPGPRGHLGAEIMLPAQRPALTLAPCSFDLSCASRIQQSPASLEPLSSVRQSYWRMHALSCISPERRNRTPACLHAPGVEVPSKHQPDSPRPLAATRHAVALSMKRARGLEAVVNILGLFQTRQ